MDIHDSEIAVERIELPPAARVPPLARPFGLLAAEQIKRVAW